MRVITLLLSAMLALSGCAAGKLQSSLDVDAKTMHQQRIDAFNNKDNDGSDTAIQKVSGSFLGGAAETPSRSRALPPATHDFIYTFGDSVNMSKVAERVTLITGIPVRLSPDVFMPLRSLLPTNTGAATQTGVTGAQAPMANPVPTANGYPVNGANGYYTNENGSYDASFKGPYRGSLAGFLDLVCARGLNWEFQDNTIYISRLVTRTFYYRAPVLASAKSTVSLGKTGGVTTGSGSSNSVSGNATTGNYDGTVTADTTVDMSAWTSLAKDIDAVKSPVGHYSIARESNTVVVTDLPEIVEKIGTIIKKRSLAARKQVNVTLEVINVTTTSESDFGIDWSIVGQKLSGITPDWSLSLSSPASVVSSNVGVLAFNSLAGNPSMNGSKALLSALNEVGTANAVMRIRRTAANNVPTSFALTDQGSYICSTSSGIATTTTGGTTGGTVGIQQCTYTVGYTLTLTLTVLDNGRIGVNGSYDFSELKDLSPITSAGQLLQQPLITDLGDILQASEIKSGQTLIMTALEKRVGNYDKRGLAEGGAIGSFTGQTSVQSIIVLFTPTIVGD